jgi:tellurite resistance-related uncharacterized protein
MSLPPDFKPYRHTDVFCRDTVPAALLRSHATKAGTWGLIHVVQGVVAYRITDPRREPVEVLLGAGGRPGEIEPTVLHEVEPMPGACFFVEFYRQAA